MENKKALSLGFDKDQIGWALRNLKEAEALLAVARNFQSTRISQELVERSLTKSFSAFLRSISCTLLLDSDGQIAQAQVASRSLVVKFSNLFRLCMSAVREGRLSYSDMIRVGEMLNRACLSIVNTILCHTRRA
ncbi:MAG: hypothetical protein ACUVTL_00555 [Thermoproteota archaeon]